MRHLALIVAIVGALAVATVWAIRVPIFQEPDELAHADYAFALYDAGGPFYRTEATLATEVTPQVRYLVAAAGYRAMRYNPYARMAPGYGTATYYRALDAHAPASASPDAERIPYVAGLYPIGYYALVASAMATGAVLGHGSLSATFFAARLLNVALLGVTLAAAYAIFLRLGAGRRTAALGTTAVGFLPLVSSVAGYVQPDNLVAALFGVVLALSLGRPRSPARRDAAVGLLLAATVLVKAHYAFALALAVVPYLALRGPRAAVRRDLPRVLAWTVAVPLAAYALSTTLLNPVRHLISPGAWVAVSRAHAHAGGVSPLAILADGGHAFADAFFGGVAAAGFWLHFGVRSGTYVPSAWATGVRFALVAATCLTMGLFGAVEYRIAARLAHVARRRSPWAAARLATASTPVAAYLIVTAMLLAIGAVTHGGLVIQGRYWIPVVTGLAVLLIVQLPKLAPAGPRRRMRVGAAAGAAVVALAASVGGLFALEADFYHPPAHGPTADSIADIESLRAGSRTFAETEAITIVRGDPVELRGYALDMRTGLPARAVVVSVDGRDRGAAAVGRDDRRLAVLFNDAAIERSGFSARLVTNDLRPGVHLVRCYLANANGGDRLAIRRTIRLRVVDGPNVTLAGGRT